MLRHLFEYLGKKIKVIAFISVAVGINSLCTIVAHAHPLLDSASELVNRAEFDAALSALYKAEASGELSRRDVVRLLFQRAIVHFALHDQSEMIQDLSGLASLEPDYRFDESVPPPIRRAFPRNQPKLSIATQQYRLPMGIRIRATVLHDAGQLVREVRIAARVSDGQWQIYSGNEIRLPLDVGDQVEFYSVVVGRSGTVLAHTGTEQRPIHSAKFFPSTSRTEHTSDAVPRDDDESYLWWWVGGGTALAVTTAVLIALVVGEHNSSTTVSPPPFGINTQ